MSPELSGNWAAPRSAAGLLQREVNELKPCGAAEATMYSEAGAGTTGTGAVRGRTRRPTFPAVVCRGGRQGRGGLALAATAGRALLVWGGRIRRHCGLLGDVAGPPAGVSEAEELSGAGIAAGSTVADGGGIHHEQPPARPSAQQLARIRGPRVPVSAERGRCRP